MKPKITALAITFNEEENVKRYVQSLSFADEIIFIDSFSSDKTVEIAKESGVIVFQRAFDNFANQKNFAIEQAKNDWIVFFDLDEVISPELTSEILKNLDSPDDFTAYSVKRNLYFFGKQIKFGGWQSDKVIRIFNKKFCKYDENFVLGNRLISSKTKLLKEKINHLSYKSFDSYNTKLSFYGKLEAEHLYSKNQKPNFYHFIIKPNFYFFKKHLFSLGFLDGKEGFILAYIHAFSVLKKYLHLWMKYRKIE
ncbi:glycosyltransferase family 2 protein [Flavobacterium undicola]|uniref:glycosyltransferase family 2 protein n=1 Tax=Flavobacterium undicola TaxID=1932779 RepID=UPI0013769CC1|nr:glycosyltransferase family 2 protein [Flavobacterium undicola]MBA0883709.1 glycosyltransferase family 2 protein [Flavobacterium undicola]